MNCFSAIYILFSCDQWKSYDSMRLVAASTDIQDIYKAIKTEISQGNMDYHGSAKRRGVMLFSEDWKNNRINLDLLDYGYVAHESNLACKKMKAS